MTLAKTKADDVAALINKQLGAGTISKGNDPKWQVKFIPTGILPIDVLLSGGIPRGRITEFFGEWSSGKSWIALMAIVQCQAAGELAVLIDTEHSFDPEWAKQCGVDISKLQIMQPVLGELAVDAMQLAIAADVGLVVWDSIASTQPKQESTVQLSGDRNIQPARLAQLMSTALRRLNATNKTTAILCINQTRSKVGVMFGSPETTPGGKALPYFASHRIALRKVGRKSLVGKAWDGEKNVTTRQMTHQKIKAELVKSKLTIPEREVFFLWDVEKGGVDETDYLAAYCVEHGLLDGTPKTARTYLEHRPKTRAKLRAQILED